MKSTFNNKKQSTKGSVGSDFGNSLRDYILNYKIENEVGHKLELLKEDNTLFIELFSTTGKSLGGGKVELPSNENFITKEADGSIILPSADLIKIQVGETTQTLDEYIINKFTEIINANQ